MSQCVGRYATIVRADLAKNRSRLDWRGGGNQALEGTDLTGEVAGGGSSDPEFVA